MPETRVDKSADTLQRIIAAAKDEFAEKGYAGARVDAIAQRAGVNKAALYYHIGDKKALYAEVIHDVVGTAALRIADGISGNETPEEKIRTYIRTLAKTFDDNPQMPRIMMREIASGAQNLPGVFFQDLVSILGTLTSIIDEGKEKGVFVDTLPLLVHFMAIGATVIYKSIAPIVLSAEGVPDEMRNLEGNVSGVIANEIERLILKAIAR